MRLWCVSNGAGEDQSGALVLDAVRARFPGWALAAVPLVGDGARYRERGIPVPVPGSHPSSGGFSTISLRAFLWDLPSLSAYIRIIRDVSRLARRTDRLVVMGDVFALAMARIAIGPATVFVSLPKSDFHLPHTAVEQRLMRAWAGYVLARDEPTAASLQRAGLEAGFLGNPLMDDLEPSRPLPDGPPLIALLPGSRAEAIGNLGVLLQVVDRLPVSLRAAAALPDWFDAAAMARVARAAGWTVASEALTKGMRRVDVYRRRFADVMHAATLVVGMAGTANEQAAGLGKVVVTCRGTGPQSSAWRLRQQERLLGGAAVFVDGSPEAVAARVHALLADETDRETRGGAGRDRMGPPGAAARIADVLISQPQGGASGASSDRPRFGPSLPDCPGGP